MSLEVEESVAFNFHSHTKMKSIELGRNIFQIQQLHKKVFLQNGVTRTLLIKKLDNILWIKKYFAHFLHGFFNFNVFIFWNFFGDPTMVQL